ncbi:MAG: hypothetical protein LBJ00_08505 [Planctomycetaceae bacterium]|nr:hypothetical protein [Planctomycetaceae bacterium]
MSKKYPTTKSARATRFAHKQTLHVIPKPVWGVGFALEQPLRDATLACSASGISKQLKYNTHN